MKTSLLEITLAHVARGFRVHPLKPGNKEPLTQHGWKDASGDEAQIREWWTKWPDANVGIACGPSGIAVVDCDHGLTGLDSFIAWRDKVGLPPTYAVRTGRRDEYGVHMYYRGLAKSGPWENIEGCSGDTKSTGGYVAAAGSVHQSGERYEVIVDCPLAPLPEMVRGWRKAATASDNAAPDATITERRHERLLQLMGKWHQAGLFGDALLAAVLAHNEIHCDPPLEEDDVIRLWRTTANWTRPEPVGEVVIGKPKQPEPPKDWREHYHTLKEHDSVGPPEFLIEGFLQRQAIMGLGAFVGQKKTLLALNVAWSLCSGEPLFGMFKVTKQASRVLYLGPENGMISFANRVNRIGLRDYLGETFFYTTMSMPEKLPLTSLTHEEIQGAAIFIDTAIRYTEGSENDASQMKGFAELAFSLIRGGAECVVMLHHSSKSMTQASELTLENCFRGTGELSAFLSVAVGLRTQDMTDEYNSRSLIRFVKQRDFEPKPSSFEVTTARETCRMTFVDGSHGATVCLKPSGTKADADGQEEAALQVIRDNPKLSNKKTEALLKKQGINRSATWIGNKKYELFHVGVNVEVGATSNHSP